MVRDLEESEARAWSLAPPNKKNPTASARHTSSEWEKQKRAATSKAEKSAHGRLGFDRSSLLASTLADEADLCHPSSSSSDMACLDTLLPCIPCEDTQDVLLAKVTNHTKTKSRPAVANHPNADLHRKRKCEAYDDTIPGRGVCSEGTEV